MSRVMKWFLMKEICQHLHVSPMCTKLSKRRSRLEVHVVKVMHHAGLLNFVRISHSQYCIVDSFTFLFYCVHSATELWWIQCLEGYQRWKWNNLCLHFGGSIGGWRHLYCYKWEKFSLPLCLLCPAECGDPCVEFHVVPDFFPDASICTGVSAIWPPEEPTYFKAPSHRNVGYSPPPL